jgi:hypothetical protein
LREGFLQLGPEKRTDTDFGLRLFIQTQLSTHQGVQQMNDVTRRQAIKAAATTGVITTGALAMSGKRTEAAEVAQDYDAVPESLRQEFPRDMKASDAELAAQGVTATRIDFKHYRHQEPGHYTIKGELYCKGDDSYTTGHIGGLWFLFGYDFYLDKTQNDAPFIGNFGEHKVVIVFYKIGAVWHVGFIQYHWDNIDKIWRYDKFVDIASC